MRKLILLTILGLAGCTSLLSTVENRADLPSVALNDYIFHAETFGNPGDPVVIVLHGGPGADYRYMYPLKDLSSDHLVVFYDQRGTGLSPRVAEEDVTVESFIADLDAFVTHYGRGQQVSLIGHSWGAMLASAYVGRYPGKVDKIVLAEPAFLDQETYADIFAAGGWPGFRVIFGFATAWVKKWGVRIQDDPQARDDFFLMKVMPLLQSKNELCEGKLPPLEAWRFGYSNFSATLGRMIRDPDWGATLDFSEGTDAFPGKALFLVGECNKLVGEDHQRKHLKLFTNVTLESVPDAGHFMFNDQPELSIATVRGFLSQ